ncbi:ATP-binding cassette domain-containing protein [Humibacillus xanthopallidus]|uniref:ATP-binding cassette domain-containing protein n=1 Tax=Humibacillus xanthopallidus TaxID=412689 RepID=UPI0038512185
MSTTTRSATTTRTAAVEIADLRVSYGDHVVLDGLDLSIAEGTVLAMLGPNGAGKTTTVNVLSTLLRADSGRATVCGHDVATDQASVRSVIGVTGQFSAVDGLLTGAENLLLMGDLHHLPRAESRSRAAALLERFDVADAAGERVATWSGGMQRKLDLAMTLMGEPRVIFLDEPTTGLDPRSRRGLWDLVRGLVADGVTILLTTQYLDEADRLADTVAVLDGGRIVAQGTPAELKRQVPGGAILLHLDTAAGLDQAAHTFPEGTRHDETLTLSVPAADGIPGLRSVLDRLERDRVEATHLEVTAPDLDDVFLALTSDTRKAS